MCLAFPYGVDASQNSKHPTFHTSMPEIDHEPHRRKDAMT